MSGLGPRTANTFNAAVPSNYVAGIGRGAQGFTTRSDIGPARVAPSAVPEATFGQAPEGYVAGGGRGMGMLAKQQGELSGKDKDKDIDQDRGDYSESNYNKFGGYSENLFKDTVYEDDDVEADRIYEAIDERMERRRKRKRELVILNDLSSNDRAKPTIAGQFADLKRDLASVSADQWEGIPEVGDHTLKYKQKQRTETFAPVPDFLITRSTRSQGDMNGASSTGSSNEESHQVTSFAEARGTILSLKLDKMSDSVSGQTVVDPKGYLTDLNSLKVTSDADIGDIKKARALLSSVTSTNPKHAPGWIAAARVEKVAGKLIQARKIIQEGCDSCPDSVDIWLEAAHLHSDENAKTILANAVKHLPTSVEIWMLAAELEKDLNKKKIVLRRALEFIPNSEKLWKCAIGEEDASDARIMLTRAVECIPHCVDMWLALAKLETYDNARKVLNQARNAVPTEPAIWITASKLEEANGNGHAADKIIEKAISSLAQFHVVTDREFWLREAEVAEEVLAPYTCRAIVKNTIHYGLEDEDKKRVWMDDAESCLQKTPPAVETARAIYNFALSQFPSHKSLWVAAATLEKDFGGVSDKLEAILKEGVKNCPHAEILWLMAAKEKWLNNDIPGARAVLVEAFNANTDSEQIWLAAVKLEWENNELERARALLAKARERAPSERIWLKSALLSQELGDLTESLKLLDSAIEKYPYFAKFYMMAGSICQNGLENFTLAKEYFSKGLQNCPESIPLWILAVRLEEVSKGTNKARSTIEVARLKNPKDDALWLESIRLERRAGNNKLCEALMAKAIQTCPTSGVIWSEDLLTCEKAQQKSKSIDALKKCDSDPHVVLAVARLFELDRKYLKAEKWFARATTLNPDLGDSWAYYYAFELRQTERFTSEKSLGLNKAESVYLACVSAEPKHGELWCSVSKSQEFRRRGTGDILKESAKRILSCALTDHNYS